MNLREEFEKTETFKKCEHWSFKFDEKKKVYIADHLTYMSHAIAMNAAWMMFQELKNELN